MCEVIAGFTVGSGQSCDLCIVPGATEPSGIICIIEVEDRVSGSHTDTLPPPPDAAEVILSSPGDTFC